MGGRTDILRYRSLCKASYVRLKFCQWQNLDRIFVQSDFLLQERKNLPLKPQIRVLRADPKNSGIEKRNKKPTKRREIFGDFADFSRLF